MKLLLNVLIPLLVVYSMNLLANSNNEKELLSSWGIQLEANGQVNYKYANNGLETLFWKASPTPQLNIIDYTAMPLNLDPLIIYKH